MKNILKRIARKILKEEIYQSSKEKEKLTSKIKILEGIVEHCITNEEDGKRIFAEIWLGKETFDNHESIDFICMNPYWFKIFHIENNYKIKTECGHILEFFKANSLDEVTMVLCSKNDLFMEDDNSK